MFIKGNCAIYIDKNLKVYENSTVLFFLCLNPSDTFLPNEIYTGPETLDESMKTYLNRINGVDPFAKNPWRSPGAAEIFSPCGVAGI